MLNNDTLFAPAPLLLVNKQYHNQKTKLNSITSYSIDRIKKKRTDITAKGGY